MNIKSWLQENFDFENEKVLITGGSSGIGKEYLRSFAELGCSILSVCNQAELNQNVSQEFSEKYDGQITPILCDLSDVKDVQRLVEELGQHKIPVVISNAGFGIKGNFLDGDTEKYMDIINLHVMAPTLILKSTLRYMREQNRGLVLNVAPVNVAYPVPHNTIYTATKTYIFNLALAIAKENEDTNIVFQVLLPGTTDTPFHEKQGAVPKSLTMKPSEVVKKSLANIEQQICIPNSVDKILYPVFARIPIDLRMTLAGRFLKKRLAV